MSPEDRAKDLLLRGYTEVERTESLSVGDRVRHYNEQYTEAYRSGTGTIERIFLRDNPSFERKWGYKDVEVIVKRDKPKWGPDDNHAYVANYHITGVTA